MTLDKRQEFELPRPKMQVTEYQVENRYCVCCKHTTSACFPEHITHTAQYGPRAKGLMVYLNEYQLIPYRRASEFFQTVYNHRVSQGTIVNAVNALSLRYERVEHDIKALLKKARLIHCDETGMSVGSARQWLHVVSNSELTHYAIHENRGRKATESIGILPDFTGIMVHDHWKSYFRYEQSQHALCNAHHLRELRFIHEHQHMRWAKKLFDCLLRIQSQKETLVSSGKEFSLRQLASYDAEYDNILIKAVREQAKRGTLESRNLIKRLTTHKKETLLFMHNPKVPFTNNPGEQDIRMNKVKQKISGCFRSPLGAESFCRIRSVISTAQKNQKNVFDVLCQSFQCIISIEHLLES